MSKPGQSLPFSWFISSYISLWIICGGWEAHRTRRCFNACPYKTSKSTPHLQQSINLFENTFIQKHMFSGMCGMKMYLLCDVYSGVCLSEGLRVRIWSIRIVYDTPSLSIWMREDLTSLKRIKYQVKSIEDPHQI